MSELEITQQLATLFRKVFRDETIQIFPKSTANDITSWTSLSHVQLIAEIEADFEIKFSFSEIMALDTVEDIVKAVGRKLDTRY